MTSVLLTILGISLLIFIHELGHYICARMAGVNVLVFSLGFGPRLWGFRRGCTDYRISAMPLGGYVMVAGDDPTFDRRRLGPNDLCSKGILARAFFYSGGVIMNVLFALVAFPLVFNTGVLFVEPILGAVIPGGPAWEAGLQADDRILEVGGKEMYSFSNFRVEAALANARKGVDVVYERAGKRAFCTVFPRYSPTRGLRTMGVVQASETGPFAIKLDSDDTPEYRAGLRSGDRLLTFNGERIHKVEDWGRATSKYIEQLQPNGKRRITLTVRRPLDKVGEKSIGAGSEFEIEFEPAVEENSPLRIGVAPVARRVAGILRSNADAKALDIRRGDRIRFINGDVFRGGKLDLSGDGDTVVIAVKRGSDDSVVTLSAVIPASRRQALTEAIVLEPALGPMIRSLPGSPAALAGIRQGDIVRAVDGKPIETWDALVDAVKVADGKPIQLALLQVDGIKSITVQAVRNPSLGFVLSTPSMRALFQTDSFGSAIEAGWVTSLDFIKQIYVTLKRLFTGDVSPKNLGGIITISRVSYAFAEEGLARLFYFLAILSINLAVINVLPIPVLDGGHLTFLLIEKIKGSPVSTKVHNYSQILGLVFVLSLMVYVTYNDILRWLF